MQLICRTISVSYTATLSTGLDKNPLTRRAAPRGLVTGSWTQCLSTALVSNRNVFEFVDFAGYRTPQHWLWDSKEGLQGVSELTVGAAKELLKFAGLRGTAARIAVLQCLAKARSPLSHAEVTEHLREYGFDPSTVFRSLTELADAEMFYRLDLGDGARRFEFGHGGSGNSPGHAHFVCLACGKITCLTDPDIELLTFSPTAVHPGRVTDIMLKGYCRRCDECPVADSRVLTSAGSSNTGLSIDHLRVNG